MTGCSKSMTLCCSRDGQKLRVSKSATQPVRLPPSHQHLMKYLDFAPYFDGVRERDAQGGGCVSVCDGGGKSSGEF